MGDDAVIELHVGAFTGNGQEETDAAGGGNGKNERGAAGFDGEGQAGVEVDGEFGFAGKDGDVGAVIKEQGKRTGALTRVENAEPGSARAPPDLRRSLRFDRTISPFC